MPFTFLRALEPNPHKGGLSRNSRFENEPRRNRGPGVLPSSTACIPDIRISLSLPQSHQNTRA
jgi:hypothetical protein